MYIDYSSICIRPHWLVILISQHLHRYNYTCGVLFGLIGATVLWVRVVTTNLLNYTYDVVLRVRLWDWDSQLSRSWSCASNLEQVVSILCEQVNSAFYPQRDGKWTVAYGLRGWEANVAGRWYVCVLHPRVSWLLAETVYVWGKCATHAAH